MRKLRNASDKDFKRADKYADGIYQGIHLNGVLQERTRVLNILKNNKIFIANEPELSLIDSVVIKLIREGAK